MSNKLVLQDLVDLLAKKSKITKKEADSFFRELFQLILDRIFENDSVKIKDFGTFKLVLVSSRESVDVNTGEKIEIRAHSKLSFIPDKILKSLVNKPFSQFETILLEEDVDFGTSLKASEESDNEIEEKEYIIDLPEEDAESVSELGSGKTNLVDEISDDLVDSDIQEEEVVSDAILASEDKTDIPVSSPIQYPSYNQSFVYTYTTTSSGASDSITITIPKSDLSASNSSEKIEKLSTETSVEEKNNTELENKNAVSDLSTHPKDSVNELKIDINEPVKVEEQPAINASNRDSVATDFDSVPRSAEQDIVEIGPKSDAKERRYIEPITAATNKNEDILYSHSDSEIETEEDIVLPPPVASRIQSVTKPEDTDSVKSEDDTIKQKSIYSEEDPERPLFPEEDEENRLTDDDFVPLNSDDSESGDKNDTKVINHTASNKPASIRSVSYTETIDDVEIPYHDYYAPTFGQKIKKALPWIILGLAIVGFVGYNIIPMFNIKYDYESKLRRISLTTSDTLPLMDQVDSDEVSQAAVLIDSVKVQPAGTNADSAHSAPKSLVDAKDSTRTSHVPDRKISENLKIDVINKAQMYIQRYPPKQEAKAQPQPEAQDKKEDPKPTAKVQYDSIRKGVTLRNLATKHYGNGDYWVYIYEANKKIIRNPNNVPIGTNLVMPVLSTYGVTNVKDPKELQKAQSMAAKILR